jgi:predicted NUDIX family NTP pyrophosphohydrolase
MRLRSYDNLETVPCVSIAIGFSRDEEFPTSIEAGSSFVPRRSAGLLMYRRRRLQDLEVFLVHPGGPHFAKKDLGVWTVPKGEYLDGEQPLEAAKREFHEETGFAVSGDFLDLGWIKQKGGKIVTAWAFEGDGDPDKLVSNYCEVEWPPNSGRLIEIPEVDRGSWFSLDEAKERIKSTQIPLLDRLSEALDVDR